MPAGTASCPTTRCGSGASSPPGSAGIQTIETQHDVLRDRGPERMSPARDPGAHAQRSRGGRLDEVRAQGPDATASSRRARAARTRSAPALRMIQYGDADAVVVGGAEATLTDVRLRQLQLDAGAVADRDLAAVRRAPRRVRDGRGRRRRSCSRTAEAAAARGATVLGEVAGYGSTSDAYHLTAPEPTGEAATRAIELAIARCRRRPRRDRLHQRARHLDAAQRRGRDRGAEARARRGARRRDPDLLDQVRDRAPARRGRRRRGCRDRARR